MASVLSRLHRRSPFVSPLDRPARPRAYNSPRVHATNAHSTRQRTRVPLSRRSRHLAPRPTSGSNVEKSDGTFISDIDGYYGDNIRKTQRSEESHNGMKTRKESLLKTVKTRKRVPRAMENENVRSASLRRACLTGKMATQMQLRGVLKGYVLRRRSRAGQTYIDARRRGRNPIESKNRVCVRSREDADGRARGRSAREQSARNVR